MSIDVELPCFYCLRGVNMPQNGGHVATVTMHDKRGCLHVCHHHAIWRMATSFMGGHSDDCRIARAMAAGLEP